ncbi:MAG: ROK family protein, partial [Quisquiliibacterium sp.]
MRIGIDLGGTKTEILVLADDDSVFLRKRIATAQGDYRATIQALTSLVKQAETRAGRRCTVGVCIPGTVSVDTGLVKNANSVWLNGQPLARDLQTALGRDLRIANDANCFALSEAIDGAARGYSTVFGVILGTGVGGGLVIKRKVLIGANAIAGEWGHNPLPAPADDERPGPECYCGRRGCIETWLSGPALARQAGRSDADARAVLLQALAGEPAATQALRRYCERLARALASVINLFDPQAIVLGGGLSNLN